MHIDLGPASAVILGLLLVFLGGSIWIGIALFLVGIGGFFVFTDVSFGAILANVAWNNTSGSAMMALPFFIFVLLNILNPQFMKPLYSSSIGHKLLAFSAGGMFLGAWVMNRLAVLRY